MCEGRGEEHARQQHAAARAQGSRLSPAPPALPSHRGSLCRVVTSHGCDEAAVPLLAGDVVVPAHGSTARSPVHGPSASVCLSARAGHLRDPEQGRGKH